MSGNHNDLTDWLPSDVSMERALDALQNPGNLDFYRFTAKVLENTEALDDVTAYVEPELLVKEFHKIKNHMKHGKLKESRREYWEQKVRDLARKLGIEEDQSTYGSKQTGDTKKNASSQGTSVSNDEPVPVDPEEFDIADSPSSAADTEKTSDTDHARQQDPGKSEMTGGIQEKAGFNEQVSEASRSVSEELRKLRQKRDLTRNELSENSDLPLQMISDIEQGRTELTYQLIDRYVDALNMRLKLDFQKKGDNSSDLLQQVQEHIDRTIDKMDVGKELADHTRMVLHQIAEDGLYRNRFPTIQDALNYLEEAVKQFSIRDEAPDPSLFSNQAMFNVLKSRVEEMKYSDLAFDENIKIVGQKILERFHE